MSLYYFEWKVIWSFHEFYFYFLLSSCFTLFIYFGIGLSFFLIPKTWKYSDIFSSIYRIVLLEPVHVVGDSFHPWGNWGDRPSNCNTSCNTVDCFGFFRREKILSLKWLLEKEPLCLIIICSVLFLLLSIPSLFLLNDFNVLSIGNNDIIHYATISKFLTRSSFVNPLPGISQLSFYIENNNFGAYISTAVPAVFLGLQTYMLENIILNLFFILSLPIFYLISIELFKFKSHIALIVTTLIGMNFHFIYILYNGFLGQVIGCGMFFALSFLVLYPFFSNVEITDLKMYIPPCVFLMFGMVSTYFPLLSIFFGTMGGFIVLNTVMEKILLRDTSFFLQITNSSKLMMIIYSRW